MAIRWEDMEPNAYGYIETTQSVKDILGDFRRDAYEGVPVAIPFEPRSVLTHLTQHRWESVGALAMCAALLAHFPHEDIEAIARTLPPKHFRELFETHEGVHKVSSFTNI